jgi:2-methylcitrate dehydratase PrpD
MRETAILAEYASQLRYEDIPSAALDRARNTICDTVGAIIFGYDLPWSRMIASYATSYGEGGRSRILGPGAGCVQAPMAALVNGALAHSFELDGSAKPSCGAHPCATIFPAALAVAQERDIGGKALLTAFVAATEVVLRIGSATGKSNEHRGFHGPATTGPFAATVGVGKLLGFDGAKLTEALGIAGSLSAGLLQFSRAGTGGMVNCLHFGRANESGVLAASLAERGFSGPHDILEGELGFLNVFCDTSDMSKLTAGLGQTFLTLNIYMKRYACHGVCQAPLQALEELRKRRAVSPEDIDEIEVRGAHEIVARHDIRAPRDATIAQYSVPFAVALSFFADPRDPRAFSQAAVEDAPIGALCRRVRLVGDEAGDNSRAAVRVRLTNGEVLEERVTVLKATPAAPPSQDEVYEKFSLLTRHCNKRPMDEIFERLQAIESERDLAWLAVD